jgi:hypothetical protein
MTTTPATGNNPSNPLDWISGIGGGLNAVGGLIGGLASLPMQYQNARDARNANRYNMQNSMQDTNMKVNEQQAAMLRLRQMQQAFSANPQNSNWGGSSVIAGA